MNKKKIYILEKISGDGITYLNDIFDVIDLSDKKIEQNDPILKDAYAIIVKSKVVVNSKIKETCPNLKIVARAGTGMENISKNELEKLGITCLSVPDGNSQSAAEFTLCLILMLLRKLPETAQQIETKNFRRHLLEGRELFAVKIGIIGLGNVGLRLCKMLRGLGANPIGWDICKTKRQTAKDMKIVTVSNLDILLSESDIISIHVPLTADTTSLIGMKEIKLLKKNVLIINTSRGLCIDQDSILYGLENNIISYFATDVLYPEPPFHEVEENHSYNHPFLQHPRVHVTPHIAASTKEAQSRISIEIAKKIIDLNKKRNLY